MAVYLFYASIKSNSRSSELGIGARGKTSADMTIEVKQRDQGAITTPFKIRQYTSELEDGTVLLTTTVHDKDGCVIARNGTIY